MSDSNQYIMLGGDGKEYGPVSAIELQQWINEGRANLATRVKLAGTNAWKAIGECEGFVPLPGGVAPLPAPPPQAPVAIKVFGVLNTVFGGMGVLCGPLGMLQFLVQSSASEKAMTDMGIHFSKSWMLTSTIAQFAVAVVLLIGGIGLLRERRWAPMVCIVYTILAVVLGVFGTIKGAQGFSNVTGPFQSFLPVIMVAMWVMLGLRIAYYGVMIYFLTRPAVKDYLAAVNKER